MDDPLCIILYVVEFWFQIPGVSQTWVYKAGTKFGTDQTPTIVYKVINTVFLIFLLVSLDETVFFMVSLCVSISKRPFVLLEMPTQGSGPVIPRGDLPRGGEWGRGIGHSKPRGTGYLFENPSGFLGDFLKYDAMKGHNIPGGWSIFKKNPWGTHGQGF